MGLYLLDTNALSRLARGTDSSISAKVAQHLDDCALSAIAWYELEYGAARSPAPAKSRQRLALVRSIFPFLHPFGEDAASEAAAIRAHLEKLKPNAQPIGPHDILLAGHAMSLGATFVTHNTREFARVPGLALEDWQSTAGS